MSRGKHTCKILREIRQQIAEANDIMLITSECTFKGDCRGTCPKCEAEVAYLEEQLRQRSLHGNLATIAGISLGLIAASCSSSTMFHKENDSAEANSSCVDSLFTKFQLVGDYTDPSEISEEIESNQIPAPAKSPTAQEANPIKNNYQENRVFGMNPMMPPTFPGGEAELMKFIQSNIIYPKEALMDSIQGRVVTQFHIDSTGCVTEAKVVRSKHPQLDAEAIRVMMLLPKFKPARQNGKNVDCWFTMPVQFRLPQNDKNNETQKQPSIE